MLPFTMFYAKVTSLLALDSCYKGIFSSYKWKICEQKIFRGFWCVKGFDKQTHILTYLGVTYWYWQGGALMRCSKPIKSTKKYTYPSHP